MLEVFLQGLEGLVRAIQSQRGVTLLRLEGLQEGSVLLVRELQGVDLLSLLIAK